jgi:hypothetical protein
LVSGGIQVSKGLLPFRVHLPVLHTSMSLTPYLSPGR